MDASEAVVKKLRGKNGGASMPVAIGDFATLNIEGRFSLVYVVFNTRAALLAGGPDTVFLERRPATARGRCVRNRIFRAGHDPPGPESADRAVT